MNPYENYILRNEKCHAEAVRMAIFQLILKGTCARLNCDNSQQRINTHGKINKRLCSRLFLFYLCNCSELIELCLAQVPKKENST